MDKIRNNLPFEGELSASSTSTQPPVSRAPKKVKNTKKPNEPVFVPASQVASAEVTILSNFSEIIRASTSKQTRTDAQQMPMGTAPTTHFPTTFTVPFANMNLSAITGQGITLPNNLTVQALLQSIQQQAKKIQMVQQQETLPDSSSQDIISHHQDFSSNLAPMSVSSAQTAKKRQPAKKKTKKIVSAEAASKLETSTPVAQPKAEVTNALAADKKPNKKARNWGNRRILSKVSSASAKSKWPPKKNKFSNQKKRMEKLQSDLEKSADAIQLVQIDLACQKTDNNNLTAENIALKAENQQLKSKDSSSKTSTTNKKAKPVETFTSAKTTKSASAKRGRKARSPSPVNQKVDTIPETIEYGRRTSKRICVSRTRFLYGLI
uniref:Uncharacterized protein n=1 Tax=Ditylenchus dipsaci TaxID=166011 RepID=A0A915DXY1_9BILA